MGRWCKGPLTTATGEVGFRSHLLLEGNYHRMFDVRSLNDFRAFLLPQWSVWLIERFVPPKS